MAVAKTPRRPIAKRRTPAGASSPTNPTTPAEPIEAEPIATPDAPTETTVKAKSETAKKQKKLKVVRDSFTMPRSDYDKIAKLKKRCLKKGAGVKKSELLRAGLHLLERLTDADLATEIDLLENVKTGRPAKHELGKPSRKARKRK